MPEKAVKIDGPWRWRRLALDSKDRLKPDVVILDGQEETHKEGRFGFSGRSLGGIALNRPVKTSSKPRPLSGVVALV